ncbi:hypothetical protein WA026_004291 [Henosepilachna vigintioctopunctata]|uniref:Uncharacterized protein n=1 Tax=Henosepilachna vigintioctopunctata TaxID=420089 RepID=A0AAW1V9L6_9CUCU
MANVQFFEELEESLGIVYTDDDYLIWTGDFNIDPYVDTCQSKYLDDILKTLVQTFNEPPCVTQVSLRKIDLFSCSETLVIGSCKVKDTNIDIDHLIVETILILNSLNEVSIVHTLRCFKHFNREILHER